MLELLLPGMPKKKKKSNRSFKIFLDKLAEKALSVFSLLDERNTFFQNLSLLIGSGTPLVEGLRIISSELRSRRMRLAVEDIWMTVEDGGNFWSALAEHRYIFSEYEIRMVKIAEESGTMEKSLAYLADQLEKDSELRGKIRSALFYPAIVLSFAGVIGLGVSWFVLPKLSRAFASLRINLPLVTEILINIGDFVNKYGQIVFPVFIILIFILILLVRLTRLRFWLLGGLEIVPGLGDFLRQVRVARLSLFMGTLLEAGVPLVETLDTLYDISEVTKEKVFFKNLKEQIEIGNSFETSFSQMGRLSKIFPPVTRQMIFVAEKSGRLPEVFLYIANLYGKKVDLGAKNLTQTLEPILLVAIAGVVAFVAIAIILPIYSLLGGLQAGTSPRQTQPETPAISAPMPAEPTIEEPRAEAPAPPAIMPQAGNPTPEGAAAEAPSEAKKVRLLSNRLGYINVRAGPGTNYKLLRRIDDEGVYEYTTMEFGWYRIILTDGAPGWIYGEYARQ